MGNLTHSLDIVTGIHRSQKFHIVLSAEQAFVAILHNQQFGGHIAEKGEHVRTVNQISTIMSILGTHSKSDH